MIHGRVLPEGADLVHDREAQLPGRLERGQRREHRGVRVEHVGGLDGRRFLDPARQRVDQGALSHERNSADAGRSGAVEGDASDHLVRGRARAEVRLVLRRRDRGHAPPPRSLGEEDALAPEGVPAVKGKAVVQDVEDAHQAGTRSRARIEVKSP